MIQVTQKKRPETTRTGRWEGSQRSEERKTKRELQSWQTEVSFARKNKGVQKPLTETLRLELGHP